LIKLLATTLTLATVCLGQQPQLQISSPVGGTVFNPGQTISLTVTSPANTSFTSVGVVGEDPFGVSSLATAVPAKFSFKVPAKIAMGKYQFTADGTTASGQAVEAAPVLIDIERPEFPVSLKINLAKLIFQTVGQAVPLSVFATFSDGTVVDVSESSYLTFVSSNPHVATVDARGVVTAVASGSGSITATYTSSKRSAGATLPVLMPPRGVTGGSNIAVVFEK
jgi:Bacterial Ig-like domain (group 2)